ncbi:MAG: hypothetical protein ABI761_12405 [Saprospiraceae bacterium]
MIRSVLRFGILYSFMFICVGVFAQNSTSLSQFDSRYWGVVLEQPAMKNVVIKRDITYLKDEKGNLKIDIYSPPNL